MCERSVSTKDIIDSPGSTFCFFYLFIIVDLSSVICCEVQKIRKKFIQKVELQMQYKV